MHRGSTPFIRFVVDIDLKGLTALNISLSQDGKIVLEKGINDVYITDNNIDLYLSEKETLMFKTDEMENAYIDAQLKFGFGQKRIISDILQLIIRPTIKDGVLDDQSQPLATEPTIGREGTNITAEHIQRPGYVESPITTRAKKNAVELEPNLKAENIKKDVSIFGTVGTLDSTPTGSSDLLRFFSGLQRTPKAERPDLIGTPVDYEFTVFDNWFEDEWQVKKAFFNNVDITTDIVGRNLFETVDCNAFKITTDMFNGGTSFGVIKAEKVELNINEIDAESIGAYPKDLLNLNKIEASDINIKIKYLTLPYDTSAEFSSVVPEIEGTTGNSICKFDLSYFIMEDYSTINIASLIIPYTIVNTLDINLPDRLTTNSIGGASHPSRPGPTLAIDRLIIRNKSVPNYGSNPEDPGIKAYYVPDNLVESYKTNVNWQQFAAKIFPISSLPPELQ